MDKIDDIRRFGKNGANDASISLDTGVSEHAVRKHLCSPRRPEVGLEHRLHPVGVVGRQRAVVSSILPGRARQGIRPETQYGEGRAPGPRGRGLRAISAQFLMSTVLEKQRPFGPLLSEHQHLKRDPSMRGSNHRNHDVQETDEVSAPHADAPPHHRASANRKPDGIAPTLAARPRGPSRPA